MFPVSDQDDLLPYCHVWKSCSPGQGLFRLPLTPLISVPRSIKYRFRSQHQEPLVSLPAAYMFHFHEYYFSNCRMQSCVVSCLPVPKETPGSISIKNLSLSFFLQFFPCWFDQDIVNIERAEKLLPVVDPVKILCLVGCDLSGSHIYHIPHLLDGCLDLF